MNRLEQTQDEHGDWGGYESVCKIGRSIAHRATIFPLWRTACSVWRSRLYHPNHVSGKRRGLRAIFRVGFLVEFPFPLAKIVNETVVPAPFPVGYVCQLRCYRKTSAFGEGSELLENLFHIVSVAIRIGGDARFPISFTVAKKYPDSSTGSPRRDSSAYA